VQLTIRRYSSVAGIVALCIVGTASAQPAHLSEQQARQIAEHLDENYVAAWNAHDPDALANLFSEHPSVLPGLGGGVWDSREAIKAAIAPRMNVRLTETLLEAHAAGDIVWTIGEWTATPATGAPFQGRVARIAVLEGDDWRIRMQMSNVAVAPK
jgi:uncharacterized protein (TIGR02246 family)